MQRRERARVAIFILFVAIGGLWIALPPPAPVSTLHSALVVALGLAFVFLFMWMLGLRLRSIMRGTHRLGVQLTLVAVDLALFILGFAAVYSDFGLIDNTVSSTRLTYSFTKSLYYSIVTFTTLGYGDFYPVGLGRALAAMQALTGYIVLGILATTGAAIISPYSRAGHSTPAESSAERVERELHEM